MTEETTEGDWLHWRTTSQETRVQGDGPLYHCLREQAVTKGSKWKTNTSFTIAFEVIISYHYIVSS